MSSRNEPTPSRLAEDAARSPVGDLLSRVKPVEPAPGAAERSWRRLSSELHRPSRSLLWVPVSAAAMAVLIAAASWLARASEVSPLPQRILTPGGATATLRFGAFELRFEQQSSASVVEGEETLRVRLDQGAVTLRRDVDAEGQLAQVTANDTRVEGAFFEVRVAADGQVQVMALGDSVQVFAQDGESVLRAGERWPRAPGAALTPPEKLPDPVALAPALPPAPPSTAERGEDSKRTAPREARSTRATTEPVMTPASEPRGTDASATVGEAATTTGSGSRAEGEPAAAIAGQEPKPIPTPLIAPAPTAVAGGAVASASEDAQRWATANRLVRAGSYAEALVLLDELASGSGPFSGMSLYESGRVRARHLGQSAEALRAFAAYRERHPHGALLQEVDLTALEVTIEAGDLPDALLAAEAFLSTHSSSERAMDVRLLRANILRDLGRLADARAAYESLVLVGGRTGAEALFSAAFCARELGDEAGARRALETYLTKYPQGSHRQEALRALGRPE